MGCYYIGTHSKIHIMVKLKWMYQNSKIANNGRSHCNFFKRNWRIFLSTLIFWHKKLLIFTVFHNFRGGGNQAKPRNFCNVVLFSFIWRDLFGSCEQLYACRGCNCTHGVLMEEEQSFPKFGYLTSFQNNHI